MSVVLRKLTLKMAKKAPSGEKVLSENCSCLLSPHQDFSLVSNRQGAVAWALPGSGLLWGLSPWQWDTQSRVSPPAAGFSHLAWGTEVFQEDLGQVSEPCVG